VVGVRRSAAPDPLDPFVGYVKARFVDDPHLGASALFNTRSRTKRAHKGRDGLAPRPVAAFS